MTRHLNWYTIILELLVTPADEGQRALADFQEELGARPYYRRPQVSWQPQRQRIVVQIDREGTDEHVASELMADELLEVASAVLSNAKRVHVDVLDVHMNS